MSNVQEILEVLEGGILIRNKLLSLTIRCLIADAPARAFVLNHYGHNSSNPCSKCKVEGQRCTVPGFAGTMIFQGTRHELRTDHDYQNLVDEDHHKGGSPLSPLLGLTTRVPFEIMHSVWLGNCKKVISAHVSGKFGFRRMNGRKLEIINSRMLMLQQYCPSEFNRRPQEITITSDSVQVYHCENLAAELQAIPFSFVKRKVYMMPKWSDVEGEEELVVANQTICASLLSPLHFPENVDIQY